MKTIKYKCPECGGDDFELQNLNSNTGRWSCKCNKCEHKEIFYVKEAPAVMLYFAASSLFQITEMSLPARSF